MFIIVELLHTNKQKKKSHYPTIQLKLPADFSFPLPLATKIGFHHGKLFSNLLLFLAKDIYISVCLFNII